MRCLVTGGLGFIGSHLVERLVKAGHMVRILDNFSTANAFQPAYAPGEVEIVNGDIGDADACREGCRGIDVVFHNAAVASIRKSIEEPVKTIQVNVNGTLNILQASVEAKVKRFIFSSSAKIYGNGRKFRQAETDAPRLLTPYDLSKTVGEDYCKFFSHRYHLEVVSLRHFSVYGPRQSFKNGFIGIAIEHIVNKSEPVFYAEPGFLRDFTFIDDVVHANLLAAHLKYIQYEVFNTGTGHACTLSDMMQKVNQLCERNIKARYMLPQEGTVHKTLSDIAKSRNILKYSPRVKLEEGLQKTIAWYLHLRQSKETQAVEALES